MKTTQQITKKQFEEMINKLEGFNEETHGNNKAQKANKRPYGTYIRSADKELFDKSYERYINTGVYHLSLWDQE